MPSLVESEPARIKALRLQLAKSLPRFPNDKAALNCLEEKSLGGLLIDYLNWANRFIIPRPRKVIVQEGAALDPRFTRYQAQIEDIVAKARSGSDLTPYLSIRPHTRGYSPNAARIGPKNERWIDKDFVLNVMGFHHLHFDALPHDRIRSDDMLFVKISRADLLVVGIFDHSVFSPPAACMSDDKVRLWQTFESSAGGGAAPNPVIALTPIATSGHSLTTVHRAAAYARRICAVDRLLDHRSFVEKLYADAGYTAPNKTKLKWAAYFQEIGIYDVTSRGFFSVCSAGNQ